MTKLPFTNDKCDKQITVKMTEELYEWISEQCITLGMSKSKLIRLILQNYYES